MSANELGNLSERIVAAYFEHLGSIVEPSTDPYDGSKDMLIDKVRTEVKFQTIYHYFKPYNVSTPYKAFTVPVETAGGKVSQNQLDKCLNAERWIIVQNPSSKLNEKFIRLWEAPPLGQRRFKTIRNKHDGRIVAGFPLSSFTKIVDINNKELYNKIKQLNISEFS